MQAKKLTLTISILIPLLKSIKSPPRTKFRISIFKILNFGNKIPADRDGMTPNRPDFGSLKQAQKKRSFFNLRVRQLFRRQVIC